MSGQIADKEKYLFDFMQEMLKTWPELFPQEMDEEQSRLHIRRLVGAVDLQVDRDRVCHYKSLPLIGPWSGLAPCFDLLFHGLHKLANH